MYFETLTELWQMAGHGPYVWSSYAITYLVWFFLIMVPIRQLSRQKRLTKARYEALRQREVNNGDAS
jgi:heme exporter protein D